MAAQANVVLTDGEPTPVARTFNPRGTNVSSAKWAYVPGGIAAGQQLLSMDFREPTPQSAAHRITFKLAIPTLAETAPSTSSGYSPLPKAAYTHFFEGAFVCPIPGTEQERENLRVMVVDLLQETIASLAIEKLEPVW